MMFRPFRFSPYSRQKSTTEVSIGSNSIPIHFFIYSLLHFFTSSLVQLLLTHCSYYDLLERAELFNHRCKLEADIYELYHEQLNEFQEHSERYIPGYMRCISLRNRVIVCANCNRKIIPMNTETTEWKPHSICTPVCKTCQKPLFTCSLCSLPGMLLYG